jgi:hypothetical protein
MKSIGLVRFKGSGFKGSATLNLKPFSRIEDHFHGGTIDVSAADNHSHVTPGF